jgi:hypothetical protein
MGRVKQLWQDERDRRWQNYYDDYVSSVKEEGRLSATTPDAASQYADDKMDEEDDASGQFGVGA